LGEKCATLDVEEARHRGRPMKTLNIEIVVDEDISDLHLKPNDAMECSKWRKMVERIGVTAILMVMLRAEYELHVSGTGSPRLIWINGH